MTWLLRVLCSLWVFLGIILAVEMIQSSKNRWDFAILASVLVICSSLLAVLIVFEDALIALGEEAIKRDKERQPKPD